MGVLAATVLAGAATAILLGVRRHAPQAGGPWYWWAAALVLAALSRQPAFPLLGQQLLALVGTVLVTAGLWDCARRRQPDPDPGVLFDALALTVAVGALAWAVADPLSAQAGVPEAIRYVAASRLLALLAVVAVAVRLLTADAPRSTALRLFTAGLWLLVLGQMASIGTVLAGGQPLGWGWAGGGVLWALAALHPSMAQITTAGRGPSQRGYRNAAVAVAVLVMPILALRMVTVGDVAPGAVLLAAGVLPVILLVRLLHGLEARERAIRQSRQLADELAVSEQRYRSLFQFSPDGVFSMDLDGRITSANPVAVTMFGTSAAEGASARAVVPPAAMAMVLEHFRATVLGAPQHFETALLGAGGCTLVMDVTMMPIVVGGEVSGVYGLLHDSTDRKRRHAEVRRRAAQQTALAELGQAALAAGGMRSLLDHAVYAVAGALDVQFCGVFAPGGDDGRALLRAGSGWRPGWTGLGAIPADGVGGLDGNLPGSELLEVHGVGASLTVAIQGFEGSYGLLGAFEVAPRRFHPSDEQFLQTAANLLAAAFDRERVNAMLEASEEQAQLQAHRTARTLEHHHQALDAGRMALWVWDFQTDTVVRSPQAQRVLGLSGEDKITEEFFERIHPDDRDLVRQIVGERQDYRVTFRLLDPAGSIRWFQDMGKVEHDAKGHPVRMHGVISDVTEHMEALEALRMSRHREQETLARHRLALDAGRMAVWSWDPVTSEVCWPDDERAMDRALGDKLSRPMTNEDWLQWLHPDDRDCAVAALDHAASTGEPFDVEYRLCLPGGALRWVHDVGMRSQRPDGTYLLAGIAHDITDRKQAEERLRERDALARSVLESLPGESAVLDSEGRIVACNRAWLTGECAGDGEVWPVGTDYLARWRDRCDLAVPDVEAVATGLRDVLDHAVEFSYEYNVPSGKRFALRASPVLPGGGGIVAHFDITERRAVEEQLRRAQKMEAIGHLAGGIAHDFNNLLAAISGYTELLQVTLDPDGSSQACVAEIGRAVDRAASLVGQLMAFSKQAHVDPLPIDVNAVVSEMQGIVSRLIGEHIEIRVQLDDQAGPVLAEAGSLEQVLLNLAVNARDAMPGGGRLSISTQAVELHGPPGEGVGEWTPGPHVRLEVSDTGCGMPPDVIERIFEPFFSTKREGEGTGLGLPTVYGIVSRAGGHLGVHSVIDVGTTFTIHLPVTAERPASAPAAGDPVILAEPSVGRRVLLVEDQTQLRLLMATALEQHGYEVWVATDGADALEVADAAGHLDLVVTDVVMPHMGGPALADRLFLTRPDLRVLYMSGYATEHTTTSDFRSSFLQKPFGLHELTAAADRLVAGGYPGQVVVEGVG